MKSFQLNLTEDQLLELHHSLLLSQQSSDNSTISSLLLYIESVLSTSTTPGSGECTPSHPLTPSGHFRTFPPYPSDDEDTLYSQSPTKPITPVRTLSPILENNNQAFGLDVPAGDLMGLTGESISELSFN